MEYSAFLFSQLVSDLLINPNDIVIPYDVLYPIIMKHLEICQGNDTDFDVSEYETMEAYIKEAGSLLAELFQYNEN